MTDAPPPRVGGKPLDISQVNSLETLCRFLNIKSDQWDGFLFTDGSGSSVEQDIGIGFASILIDAERMERPMFHGSGNYGTVNSAELMAVVYALEHLVRQEAGVRQHGYRLHVISDSQYVVGGLNKPNQLAWVNSTKSNQLLWFAVHGAIRNGIVIQAHHVPRNQLFLQTICDHVSRNSRTEQYRVPKVVETGIEKSLP